MGKRLHPNLVAALAYFHENFPNVNGYSAELKDELKGGKRTGNMAVRVYVEKKKALSELKAEEILPDNIEDENGNTIAVDVIEIGHQKARSAPPFQDPTKKFRPLIGGISVGHYEITAGTIDYFVKDPTGTIGILSNNHVLANENNASMGDPILQPGAYDGGTLLNDQIAKLAYFVPIVYDGTQPSNCPNAAMISGAYNGLAKGLHRKTRLHGTVKQIAQNQVDCAWATLNDQTNYLPQENGLFSPIGVSEAVDGDVVTKSGRTTGVTTGLVIDTAGTITVGYGGSNVATFIEQVIVQDMTTPFSAGGDSGSLIMRQSDQKAVALLFAGGGTTTIGNHIALVLSSLGGLTFV
jgi:hypothetical protein